MKGPWKGKNVLVTGAGGFIGGRLSEKLKEKGANVVGLEKKNAKGKGIKWVKADIVKAEEIREALEGKEIGCCFHLAAQANVGEAGEDPSKAFEVNVTGTVNVLEAMLEKKAEGVVMASSGKVYGEKSGKIFRENSELNPSTAYGASKAAADEIGRNYSRFYPLAVAVVRSANVFGPGDKNYSRFVPNIISRASKGKGPRLAGNGKQEKDFVFIDDVAEAYILLMENISGEKARGQAFNVASGKPVSLNEIGEKILSIMEKNLTPEYGEGGTEGGQKFCIEKIRKAVGWKPRYSLEEGLKKTIEWYSRNS